jgi:ubiquitin C-terminal hydrolase
VDPAALAVLSALVQAAELEQLQPQGDSNQAAAMGAAAAARLVPRGLVNTGNSCFLNCTLQVSWREKTTLRCMCCAMTSWA